MPRIAIPEVLARVSGVDECIFDVQGDTVADALNALCEQYPSLRAHVFHDNGLLKDHFLVNVAGRLAMSSDTLSKGDQIDLILATSGGLDEPGALELSGAERNRYARHLLLPGVGEAGQRKLKNSRVLIVGTGGLGSPISMYLAAAGVGTIGLVDFDVVDESNLQRQIVHGISTVGKPKVISACNRLREINNHIEVVIHETAFDSLNAEALVKDYDVVVDGSDNYETRYLINDTCVIVGKPYVFGSIHQFDGHASVFNYDSGPCYRCLFPSPPPPELSPNAVAGGVIGVLPGVIGVIEATETVKILLGIGRPLSGRLLHYDVLSMSFDEIEFTRRADCPACGKLTRHLQGQVVGTATSNHQPESLTTAG